MKIALYQPWIYLYGGLEKSLVELVTRSEHDWVVYTGHFEPENTFKEFANVDVRVLNPTTVKRSIGGTLKSAYQVMTQKIPVDDDVDAIVVWCDGIGDLITFRNNNLPLINICSTPLRAAFDPVYQWLALKNKTLLYHFLYRIFKRTYIWVDRPAWANYDGIITTSKEVKSRIVKGKLCNDESKMVMAYPGIDWREDVSDVTYEPFVLISGRIMWTKNVQQGIDAFVSANLPKPWKLVVAGFVDEKSKTYLQDMQKIVPDGVNVEFVVFPSNEQLQHLYKTASFSLFTPLNEDWGIVPLESMSFAKPVIANAKGGPSESIISGETGFLIKSEDHAGWSEAIRQLALNPELCRSMGQKAHQHVKRYTWHKFVNTVDASIVDWVNAKKQG